MLLPTKSRLLLVPFCLFATQVSAVRASGKYKRHAHPSSAIVDIRWMVDLKFCNKGQIWKESHYTSQSAHCDEFIN